MIVETARDLGEHDSRYLFPDGRHLVCTVGVLFPMGGRPGGENMFILYPSPAGDKGSPLASVATSAELAEARSKGASV